MIDAGLEAQYDAMLAWASGLEIAENTGRAYRYGWNAWLHTLGCKDVSWTDATHLDAIEHLVALVDIELDGGELRFHDASRRAETVRQRRDAINYGYRCAGLPSPAAHPWVDLVLAGMRRVDGRRSVRRDALSMADVRAMVAAAPRPSPVEARNRAALLLSHRLRIPDRLLHSLDRTDIAVGTGRAGIRVDDNFLTVPSHDDPLLCPVTALRHLLELTPQHVRNPFGVSNHGGAVVYGPIRLQTIAAGLSALARSKLGVSLAVAPHLAAGLDERSLRRLSAAISAELIRHVRTATYAVVGFAGALRGAECCAIELEHISPHPRGMILRLPQSKTDQHGRGQYAALPAAQRSENLAICPVRAIHAWTELTGIRSGLLFPSARIDGPIRVDTARAAMKKVIGRAALPGDHFGTHSLRRGWATSVAEANATLLAVAAGGRWKHVTSAVEYIDDAGATTAMLVVGEALGRT